MRKSLAAIATLAAALAIPASVIAQEAPASQKSLAEQLVDAFNGVFGVHPGMRANHPKGVVLEGTFSPAASAASVSKAAHLQQKKAPIPVTVRFSAGSGQPTVPDTNQMPRGMAVKFSLPDGSKTDLVVLSFNGFPVATAEEFRDFLLAVAASGPDAPKPTAIEKFLAAHPAAKNFVESPKPQPVSYATLPYFGINAFKFTNAKGAVTFGRYQLRPVAGEHFLTQEQLATMGPDYLSTEIRERVRRGPAKFTLLLQVAEKDDKVDDPSIAWPDSRKQIELGTIIITKAVADSHTAEKKLLFMPGALVPGIEAADPMIAARSASYVVSLSRRAQAQ
ncbi:MAG TPA: catalase family peroxidase [Nitrospira sp.]|nr:catalase family peroxidase [Nitrospira sp.]MBS0175317.1 catalase family peroxidase [Nitrospira sp.]MCW5780353.1 catalase family peroxidase [Nitrospira sp.]HNO34547.1 catalase family peroxidase [Nitrospira sp.]HUM40967.1 catalase family peroxidase [Nitrospira sp.]